MGAEIFADTAIDDRIDYDVGWLDGRKPNSDNNTSYQYKYGSIN